MMEPAPETPGEFRVGDILRQAWRILWANFFFFAAVGTAVTLPVLYLLQGETSSSDLQWTDLRVGEGYGIELPLSDLYWNAIQWRDLWSFWLALFVSLALNTFGEAVVLVAAFRKLGGHPVQISDTLRQVAMRAGPLLGLAILYSLAVTTGWFLLLVPGLILMTSWAVCVAACTVERRGPAASLARSWSLTKGCRWKIFGIALLLITGNAITSWIAAFVLAPAGSWVASLGDLATQAMWTAYSNSVVVMIYHELRVAKEGAVSAQIAAVFD